MKRSAIRRTELELADYAALHPPYTADSSFASSVGGRMSARISSVVSAVLAVPRRRAMTSAPDRL
jgi:hypothetical protein